MRINSDSAFGRADIGAQFYILYALVCVLVILCVCVDVRYGRPRDAVQNCPAKETQHPSMVCNHSK